MRLTGGWLATRKPLCSARIEQKRAEGLLLDGMWQPSGPKGLPPVEGDCRDHCLNLGRKLWHFAQFLCGVSHTPTARQVWGLELTVPQDPLCLSLRHRFFATGALRRHALRPKPRFVDAHGSVSLGPSWSCGLVRIATVRSPVLLLDDKHLLVTAKRCQPGAAPQARRSDPSCSLAAPCRCASGSAASRAGTGRR